MSILQIRIGGGILSTEQRSLERKYLLKPGKCPKCGNELYRGAFEDNGDEVVRDRSCDVCDFHLTEIFDLVGIELT